jgi:hypothetical protein
MQGIELLAQMAANTPDKWAEVFFGLDQGQRFVVLIVAIGCVTGVICTVVGCVTGAVSSINKNRLDADLKRDMLDRGMAADEIAQVIESRPPEHFLDRWANSGGKKRRGCPPVQAC